MGFVGGSTARRIEGLSDERIGAEAVAVLRRMFGREAPAPEAVVATRWSRDPFAEGAYSYLPVGASPSDRDDLAEPVGERLFFAGEAAHRKYPATVHGAYLSGLEAARRVAEL